MAAPRIYEKPAEGSRAADEYRRVYFKDNRDVQWIRTTDFTPSCCIGQSSAFCLEFPYRCSLIPDIAKHFPYFKKADGDLLLETGRAYSHNPVHVPIVLPASDAIKVPYDILFRANQLVQKGVLPGPAVDDDFFSLLVPGAGRPSHYVHGALEHLSCSRGCCFDPANWLTREYAGYADSTQQPASSAILLDPGLIYTCRVKVTPSKVYFCGPEINVSNRVVRGNIAHLDKFIRLSIVDEDGEKMHSADILPRASDKLQTEVYRRILSTLRDGIAVGDKKFELLAFSSSQLKENSVWMFAPTPDLDAAKIRTSMGDFRSIRNVAKYAARLGQSFGSSTETLPVGSHEVESIPDVTNKAGNYVFSDGIGKISKDFAGEVAAKMELRTTPSAFQIRYGGYKGVVAVDPRSRTKLSLRGSMKKFESESTTLDVLSYSKPQKCYLNRQVIVLLSTLGVEDRVFENKQAEVIAQLDEVLTDSGKAQQALDTLFPGEMTRILQKMLLCGYAPDGEPFLAMMLQTYKASKLSELRSKTRIPLPKGRAMMGCLDETGRLDYGEVFVQVSFSGRRELQDGGLYMFAHRESRNRVVVRGSVVVAKNPCLHPGDVRVLSAVDAPELHHMVDCVVFPQKGKRPHPNECSGSDLDGDIYFVSWDPELIPPRQVPSMEYLPAQQKLLDRDVTIKDVQEYFADFIVHDNMGIISNAHLALADKEDKKAESKPCLELAKLFSVAVDYAKTGVPAKIPRNLQPREYPDFMWRPDREVYISTGIIGKLYRAVKDYDAPAAPFSRRDAARWYDPDMEAPGFEDHLAGALSLKRQYDFKLGGLMEQFGVKTEGEILCGGGVTLKMSKPINKYADVDAMHRALKSLRKEAKGWFGAAAAGGIHDEAAVLARTSAWYHVTYHPEYWGRCNDEGVDRPHFLSFPWCIHDRLIQIKRGSMNRRRDRPLTSRLATALNL